MKIQNKIILLICGLTFFSSCKRQTNPLDYTRNQLIFGSGGGFANQVNEYRLLENKRLFFRKNNDSAFVALGKQKAKLVKNLFAESENLFNQVEDLNQPGNMYYYVRLQKGNQTQSSVWGRPDTQTPEKAKELHKHLMNLVPSN